MKPAIHRPGANLLHPAVLSSLLVLVVNDHVLKRLCPGVVTGKLSDFAGVLLLPIFLHALCEVAHARLASIPPSAKQSDRYLGPCLALALLAFALPEVWAPAETAYRYGLGAGQWLPRGLSAVLRGQAWPPIAPVRATADVTDLIALPMGFVAYAIARRQRSPGRLTRPAGAPDPAGC